MSMILSALCGPSFAVIAFLSPQGYVDYYPLDYRSFREADVYCAPGAKVLCWTALPAHAGVRLAAANVSIEEYSSLNLRQWLSFSTCRLRCSLIDSFVYKAIPWGHYRGVEV